MSTTMTISVPSTMSTVAPSAPFEYGEDYAFYDARNKFVPDYYQRILASATSKIEIWDTHFRPECDGEVFKDVTCANLQIAILTICDRDYNTIQDVRDLANKIMANLRPEVSTCKLTIFAFHDRCRYNNMLWHDRFLVIDDSRYFLVGASMNNQVGSKTSFGIHFLSKRPDLVLLRRKLQSYMLLTGNAQLRHKVSRNRP